MIKKLLRLFKKKRKPNLVWLNIMNSQYYGVIGTGRTRKDFVKGEDTWQRK